MTVREALFPIMISLSYAESVTLVSVFSPVNSSRFETATVLPRGLMPVMCEAFSVACS